MANICSNIMRVYADKENEANLKKVYEILCQVMKDAEEDPDQNYMPNIVARMRPDLTEEEIDKKLYGCETRSWMDGEPESYHEATDTDPASFTVYYESKWYPTIEAWNLVLEPYGVKQVTIAEEPGCDVYINTDKDGVFFIDKYMIDIYTEENDGETASLEFKEYFGAGDEDEMIEYFNQDIGSEIGREFKTVEEIKDYIKDLNHRTENGWAVFAEFTSEY